MDEGMDGEMGRVGGCKVVTGNLERETKGNGRP